MRVLEVLEIDARTGRGRTMTRAAIYAACSPTEGADEGEAAQRDRTADPSRRAPLADSLASGPRPREGKCRYSSKMIHGTRKAAQIRPPRADLRPTPRLATQPSAGADVKTASELMGHSSTRTTLDVSQR